MIHEIAYIEIEPGRAAPFEAAVAEAAAHFRVAQGCRSFRLERSIEQPAQYRLVVGWDRVDDHMVTFRNSAGFQHWRALAGPYFVTPPRVEHVETVADLF